MSKTDSLYFRQNLSADTLSKMKDFRKAAIVLSMLIESFGESRELSSAFSYIEKALMYVNKHLSLTDPQATKETLE